MGLCLTFSEVVVTGDALADANFGRSLDANPVVAAVGLVSNC
jgi:hypothetical protein